MRSCFGQNDAISQNLEKVVKNIFFDNLEKLFQGARHGFFTKKFNLVEIGLGGSPWINLTKNVIFSKTCVSGCFPVNGPRASL